MKYYEDEGKKIIRKDLLSKEAEGVACRLVVRKPNGKIDEGQSIKNSQLRRFYNEFKLIERKINHEGGAPNTFAVFEPFIQLNRAKVEYARARNTVPNYFKEWLNDHLSSIKSIDDFRAFLLHFEAVVGFTYGLHPKD